MRLDVDALFASARGVAKLAIFFVLFLVVRGDAGDAAVPAACSRCGRTAWRSRCSPRRSCRWSSRSRPSPSTAATCAPRPRRRWSAPARCRRSPGRCTACGMRRIAAERRAAEEPETSRPDVSQPDAHHEVRAAGRLFRLRIWLSSAMWVPVLAANVVAVALGDRPADPRRAARRPDEPAARRLVGAGDLRRARRRDDHVHRDRVLGGLRRRADPDVVVLAAGSPRGCAATRS